MDLTTWPQVNPINQKNYYTYVVTLIAKPSDLRRCSPMFFVDFLSEIIRHTGNPVSLEIPALIMLLLVTT